MNANQKKRKRLKTRKEIEDKIDLFEKQIKQIDKTVKEKRSGGKLLPDELNALYNYKIQFSTGIGVLRWAMGEADE
jgi:hypothetical protein